MSTEGARLFVSILEAGKSEKELFSVFLCLIFAKIHLNPKELLLLIFFFFFKKKEGERQMWPRRSGLGLSKHFLPPLKSWQVEASEVFWPL